MTTYLYAGAAVILALLAGAVTVQTSRLSACKAEFASFKLQVETLGKEAKRVAQEKEAADKLNKEQTDAKTVRLTADLNAATRRLRDNAGRSFVPGAAPAARGADLQCYDRAGLDGALRGFAAGVAGLVSEGSKSAVDLRLAREWAQR